MKKILNLTALLILCVLLYGCSDGGIQDQVDLAAVGPQYQAQLAAPDFGGGDSARLESDTATAVDGKVRISAVTEKQKWTYSDGRHDVMLLQSQIQRTTVSVPAKPEVEQNIMEVLSTAQVSAEAEVASVLKTAQDDYDAHLTEQNGNPGDYYGFSYYTTDTVHRLDSNILSLSTYYSSYTGGSHPSNRQQSATFSSETGMRLSLQDILLPEGRTRLQDMVLQWLTQRADDYGFYSEEECAMVVNRKYGEAALGNQYTDWYLAGNSLVLFFNPYEIAPYAAGLIKITFSAEELSGLTEPGIFGSHQQTDSGNSVTVCFNGELDGSFSTIDRVVVTEGTSWLEVSCDETLYGVALVQISWVGQDVLEQSVLYAANYLSSEELIIVELASAKELKDLCLRLNSGDGTVRYVYLDEIIKDGEVYTLYFN